MQLIRYRLALLAGAYVLVFSFTASVRVHPRAVRIRPYMYIHERTHMYVYVRVCVFPCICILPVLFSRLLELFYASGRRCCLNSWCASTARSFYMWFSKSILRTVPSHKKNCSCSRFLFTFFLHRIVTGQPFGLKIFPSPLPCSCMQATFTRYIASAFEESRKPDMQGGRASPSCMPHPFLSTTNICAVCFFKISTRALPFSHLARYARLYD